MGGSEDAKPTSNNAPAPPRATDLPPATDTGTAADRTTSSVPARDATARARTGGSKFAASRPAGKGSTVATSRAGNSRAAGKRDGGDGTSVQTYGVGVARQLPSKYDPGNRGPAATKRAGRGTAANQSGHAATIDSRPGAVRVRNPMIEEDDVGNNIVSSSQASFDPTAPLPDVEANVQQHNTGGEHPDVAVLDGDTLLVAARVVSSTSLSQVDEYPMLDEYRENNDAADAVFVATAEKDSTWKHFRRNRKLQWGLAALLLVVVVLAVALSMVLNQEPGPTTKANEISAEEFWSSLQVQSAIDGDATRGQFGACVSMNRDGTRMVVGSPGYSAKKNDTGVDDDGNLVQRGLVSVYDLTDDEGWELIQKIPLTARDDAMFQSSNDEMRKEMVVALSRDGKKLAVGTPFHDTVTQSNIGQVEVFTLDAGTGTWQSQNAPMTGNENQDMFGASVSLSEYGGMMAVGAPGSSSENKNVNHGQVNVYLFNNEKWDLLGGRTIVGGSAGQRLGGSVSLSSDGFTLAAGSSATSDSTNTKVANVYKFTSGDWEEMGMGLQGGAGLFNTAYDVALSADGKRVVISNHYTFSQAYTDADVDEANTDLLVQVFQFQSNDWIPLSDNLHAANEPGEKSGYFISLDDAGDIILMGDPGRKVENGGNTGHAHLYLYNPDTGTFEQLGPNNNGEDAGDLFGFDVAISGDGQSLVSGAPTNRGGGFEYGRVKVFMVPDQDS